MMHFLNLERKCCPYDENKGKIYNIKSHDFIEQASFDVFGWACEEYYTELEKNKKTLTKWIKKVREELKSYRDTFSGL